MAYWFAGFFARPIVPQPAKLPPRACWQTIRDPFEGVGVHLPELHGERPSLVTISALASEMGLYDAESWIYLTYTCWAGHIDSVYGFSKSMAGELGPLEESNVQKVEETYLALMAHFGVSARDALDFEPFHRGFWSDAQ